VFHRKGLYVCESVCVGGLFNCRICDVKARTHLFVYPFGSMIFDVGLFVLKESFLLIVVAGNCWLLNSFHFDG
jgi:hypothetical protein